MRCIQLIQGVDGVDVFVHGAWYENAHFWPPKSYVTFLAPYLREEVQAVHRVGLKFCYLITMGLMPLLDVLKDIGIDILWGVDPVQGGANLELIKKRIGDRICVWGGVNSAVTLTQELGKT